MATTQRETTRRQPPETSPKHETRWKCRACGLLLGIVRDGCVEIRESKSTRYRARGVVTAECRRCGNTTTRSPHDEMHAPA